MPFSSLGDGLNSAMTYLLATSSSRGGLVLIDEVEEGLHHSALAGVWCSLVAAAGASGTQLVVSTHSEEAIAAAVEAMEGRVEDLTLVRLRGAARDEQPGGSDHTSPIEVVTYRGADVADAVELAVEVR